MTIAKTPRRLAAQQTVSAADVNEAVGEIASAVGGTYYDRNGSPQTGTKLDSSNFRDRGWITNDVKACPYTVFPVRVYIHMMDSTGGDFPVSLPADENVFLEPTLWSVTGSFDRYDVAGTQATTGTARIFRVDRDGNTQVGTDIALNGGPDTLPWFGKDLSAAATNKLTAGQRFFIRFVNALTLPAGKTQILRLAVDFWLKAKHVA